MSTELATRPTTALVDEIATLAAHVHAATCRLLLLIAELDRREAWGADGARSCAHWLNWRIGLDLGAAREHVRVARALAALPAVTAAFGAGELSYSKVRALTRIARPETEADLLTMARAGTAAHVESLVRAYRRVDPAAERDVAEHQEQARWLHTHWAEDGTLVVEGRLTPAAVSQTCSGAWVLAKASQGPAPGSSRSNPLSTAAFSRRVIVAGVVIELLARRCDAVWPRLSRPPRGFYRPREPSGR